MIKYCSFFGHRNSRLDNISQENLKNKILNCIINLGIFNFWLGGYGSFDFTCANYIKEYKTKFSIIKSYLVLPYPTKKFDALDKKYISETYDDIIYPPIEKTPLKFAISQRNKWIIDNSDFIIFNIDHSWGGAYNAYMYAIKRKKHFINIGNYNG